MPKRSTLPEPDEWNALVQSQAGVVTRHQALAYGMSRSAVEGEVRSRRWQRVHPRVYATFSGPLSPWTRLFAALLYSGHGAVVSGETAAQLWGLVDGGLREPFHLTVPADRRVRPRPGIVIRRSRHVADDTHPVLHPPRLRIEPTVLEQVDRCRTVDEALAVVARACQRRLTTPDRLVAACRRRLNLRWRHVVLPALADVASGAHSVLELRYLRDVERAHGLPSGERQHRLRSGLRTLWLDVRYRAFRTRVELDGRLGHDEPEDRQRDRRRDNAGVVAGEETLRYGWADVTAHACECAREVAAVLHRNGWAGKARRCGNECTF